MCVPCVPDNDERVEQYKHHNIEVTVMKGLKGRHRQHCLCYLCSKFKPNRPYNCGIAQEVYENCIKYGIVTPMWECPEFCALPGHQSVDL